MEDREVDIVISDVLKDLNKTFSASWANCWADQTEFCCQLGPSVADGILRFPFWNAELEKHNSYDVVNTIWEYITKHML